MSRHQLLKKIFIKGQIEVKSGLLIGGTNNAIGIGGIDKTVVRNPITEEPYIPGSSLKGKLRSLLEVSHGYVKELEKPIGKIRYVSDDNPQRGTTLLFGSVQKENKNSFLQRPSRLIVRDCKLLNAELLEGKTDLPYTESKTEVMIDRITSHASPRTFERVPAGAIFGLDLVLNVYNTDQENISEQGLIDHTVRGLQLLQDDYLGGNGSRGYGQVKIRITSISQRSSEFYTTGETAHETEYSYQLPDDLK